MNGVDIEQLLRHLPSDLEQSARAYGAVKRLRKITSATQLLVLMLFYAMGASLSDASAYGVLAGIGCVTAGAIMRRMDTIGDWLTHLLQTSFPPALNCYAKPAALQDYKILLVDASVVQTTGAVPMKRRLHMLYDPFNAAWEAYLLTSEDAGESLVNFRLLAGDLVIGDRAYGTIRSMEHCRKADASYVLRLRSGAFKVYDADHNAIDVNKWLRANKKEKGAFARDCFYKSGGAYVPIRICAQHKTAAEIEEDRRRLAKEDKRKGRKTSEKAKQFRDFFVVVTNLPECVTPDEVLSVYRVRWQIELLFKRFKSLLGFGSIPTKTPLHTDVWLRLKLLIAVLVERIMGTIDPSKLEAQGAYRSIWREYKLGRFLLAAMLMPRLPSPEQLQEAASMLKVEKRLARSVLQMLEA